MKNLFKNKNIRKVLFKDKYYYVLNDVICEITKSKNPKDYIQTLKDRNSKFLRCYTNCILPLEIKTKGGVQKMSCISFENILKLIEFIPSSKVEHFKNHLYEIGLLKIEELEK